MKTMVTNAVRLAAQTDPDAVVRLGFERHQLDEKHLLYSGNLPEQLLLEAVEFEALWNLHPAAYHRIKIGGRLVDTPRWQESRPQTHSAGSSAICVEKGTWPEFTSGDFVGACGLASPVSSSCSPG